METPELEESESLPVIQVADFPEATLETAHTEIIKSDLKICQMQFLGLKTAWENVSSILQVTKLVDATIKAMKARRDVLGMPYGYIGNGSKRDDFTPLD